MVRNKTLASRMAEATLIIAMGLIAFSSLAPIVHTVAVSLSDKAAVAAGYVTFWPIDANWVSYSKIVNDSAFLHSFLVSVERVLLGGGLNFLLTILLAYPLAREVEEFPARNIYMWFVIFTMLFSGGIIPLYILVKELHMFDTLWALVLPGAVPVFNVILLLNFFRALPKELSGAAYIDGAGPWYMLFKIFVPLSAPALATVTLFSIVGHWNAFFDGLIYMRHQENYPLQTYIQQLVVQINQSQMSSDPAQLALLAKLSDKTLNAAKIVVAMMPILLVYPFIQRFFIHGIVLGSVKE